MNDNKIDLELREANPLARRRLAALDLEGAEAALGEALIAHPANTDEPEPAGPEWGYRPKRSRSLTLGAGVMTAAAIFGAILLIAGGGTGESSRAYGAEVVRFAESTPLLLLEGPSWRVENTWEQPTGEGQMEFITGSPAPPGTLMTREKRKRGVLVTPGMRHERLRRVELTWHDGKQVKLVWRDGRLGQSFYSPSLGKTVTFFEPHPNRIFETTIPALGAKVYVDPRAEYRPIQGGPGDRLMVALWKEGGHLLELRTSVPNLAAFRERLGWLHRVDAKTWLDAMPAKVVKAAEYGATVHQMLHGIPLPPGFESNEIPNLRLTTDRYQVGAAVGGTVACAWFRYWGEARANHDAPAIQEAERVLLRSETDWPIFRQMSKEGAYPATVVEYAKAMPSGQWYGRPLLAAVDSEGGLCGPGSAGAPGTGPGN
jgi:hypothetical protein